MHVGALPSCFSRDDQSQQQHASPDRTYSPEGYRERLPEESPASRTRVRVPFTRAFGLSNCILVNVRTAVREKVHNRRGLLDRAELVRLYRASNSKEAILRRIPKTVDRESPAVNTRWSGSMAEITHSPRNRSLILSLAQRVKFPGSSP